MRIRMKSDLALGVVVLCTGVGVCVMHFVENLQWLDLFCLLAMLVMTFCYGDRAFKSMNGRIFASIWMLISTLVVARAFLYLAEARVDKRHRRTAKWVLGQDLTISEFLVANIDNNGFMSENEFFKLYNYQITFIAIQPMGVSIVIMSCVRVGSLRVEFFLSPTCI
ncbi:hypothetical protein UlMin_000805 [Ulmus minor]